MKKIVFFLQFFFLITNFYEIFDAIDKFVPKCIQYKNTFPNWTGNYLCTKLRQNQILLHVLIYPYFFTPTDTMIY